MVSLFNMLQRIQCLVDRKMQGPHTCDKIQNAYDGWMLDSTFVAYVLEHYIREDPMYKIKNLRHLILADLKHEVSHYNVFFNLHFFFNTM